MIILERFSFRESPTEERTKNSPPATNKINPNKRYKILI
ncbi:hypothetical protein NMS_1816 [Nonlabens marinus S1-08]|uniref:Uncharacterized protein n=1 Tax=Nonlabens marinus S1-08 TaxID=1454201 RepID=W8VRU5_9FLAO|nr:hypothetical protein NMS_1816 [Nonlabens marinus S1-08]